jgi:oligopeptide transport system ATP-binding protein
MRDEAPILVAERLCKSFALRRSLTDIARRVPPPRVQALDDVSISLSRNETLGVVGESGSGKSTLAHCIVRLAAPDRGRVLIDGADITGARGNELRSLRRRVQLVYQDPYSSLNPRLTVERLIAEAPLAHRLVRRREGAGMVAELLARVGLNPADAERRPGQLSGGQRQRVAIARALALRPDVLIADEAVSALDVSVQAQILNLLDELRAELGLGVLFIAHQLAVIAHLADRVAVMYLGQVVETGPIEDVFTNAHHPYTIALLEAHPTVRAQRRRRQPALRGELPSALRPPTGCRFRTRCPLAKPICAEIEPPPVAVAPGHVARCHVLAPTSSPPAHEHLGADGVRGLSACVLEPEDR